MKSWRHISLSVNVFPNAFMKQTFQIITKPAIYSPLDNCRGAE